MRTEPGRRRALLIAGPTASGKSALAVRLAERLGGHVINADSMQVYRDLAILTARPTGADMSRAAHRLYGHVDGARTYSVSVWLADVKVALAQAAEDGAVPIVVGGTGLYFKALTLGLSDIPAVPEDVRRDIRAWAHGRETEAIHDELRRIDPETAAALRPTDPQRMLRALEVHAATGRSLKSFQDRREPPALAFADVVAVSLEVDRTVLRERIDLRFDRMVDQGALDEVAALAARGLDPNLPVMRAIGVPPLLRHLSGAMSREIAIDQAKAASRQYLKRQETFIRHQLPRFRPLSIETAEAELTAVSQSSA